MSKQCVACKRELSGYEVCGERCTSCLQDRNQFLAGLVEDQREHIKRLDAKVTLAEMRVAIETKLRKIATKQWHTARDEAEDLCETIKAFEDLDHRTNMACGDAIERLWQEIILTRHPDYGEWTYPGEAYRHIKAEFDDLVTRLGKIEGEIDCRIDHGADSNGHLEGLRDLVEKWRAE